MKVRKFNEMSSSVDKKKYDELRRYMIDFKNSYNKLTEYWSNLQGSSEVDYILSDEYPFDSSFDEVGIPEWIDDGLNKLDNLSFIGILCYEFQISKVELLHRIEEFDVVKNGDMSTLDIISLNSLYDYYNRKFHKSYEERFKELPYTV